MHACRRNEKTWENYPSRATYICPPLAAQIEEEEYYGSCTYARQ